MPVLLPELRVSRLQCDVITDCYWQYSPFYYSLAASLCAATPVGHLGYAQSFSLDHDASGTASRQTSAIAKLSRAGPITPGPPGPTGPARDDRRVPSEPEPVRAVPLSPTASPWSRCWPTTRPDLHSVACRRLVLIYSNTIWVLLYNNTVFCFSICNTSLYINTVFYSVFIIQ